MLYDKDIREPLFEFLEERYEKVRIIEEKSMGRSRADIVMVLEEEVVGIEIKSDADSYARLKRQVKDYDQYYDRNYVVVGTSHAMHIEEHVPEWWGIITVELVRTNGVNESSQQEECASLTDAAGLEYVDFYVLREALQNPKLDWKRKLGILWRPELAQIQAMNGMHKYERKSKAFVIEKILEKVPQDLLQKQVSELLFERDYAEGVQAIEEYRKEKRLAALKGDGTKKVPSVRRRRVRRRKLT